MMKSVELHCHYNPDSTVRVRVHVRDNDYPWISRSAFRRACRRVCLVAGDYLCTSDYPLIYVFDGVLSAGIIQGN